jgi:transposase-like protein
MEGIEMTALIREKERKPGHCDCENRIADGMTDLTVQIGKLGNFPIATFPDSPVEKEPDQNHAKYARVIPAIFWKDVLDLEKCRHILIEAIHGSRRECPQCRHDLRTNSRKLKRFETMERMKCPSCSKWFTALTGTVLSSTHLDIRLFVLMCFLIHLDLPAQLIAKITGLYPETIRVWVDRIKANGYR